MSVKLLFGSMLLAAVAAIGLVAPLSVQATAAPSAPGYAGVLASGSTLDVMVRPPQYPLTLAQDITSTITSTVTGITTTVPVTGASKIANAISSYFSTTVASEVMSMHASGMGFGEIFRLFQLALASGTTTEEIRGMRESGEGWGQIAKELEVPPGNKGNNLGAAVSGHTENGKGKAPEVKPNGKAEPTPSANQNGKGNGKPESPGNGNGNGKK